MKTVSRMTLILSIILMVCVSPNQVWGQNRASQRSSQSTNTTSSSSRSARSSSSDNKNNGTVSRNSRNSSRNSDAVSHDKNKNSNQVTNRSEPPRNNAPAVQDKRKATANRNNATRPSQGKQPNHTTPAPDRKPAVVPHHDSRPEPRKNRDRPHIGPSHKPAPAYHSGMHNFGYRSRHIPPKAVMHIHNDIHYYYHNGIYYRPYHAGGYIICRPPFGTRFAAKLFNTALTVALINEMYTAAQRAEHAAFVAAQYARINTSYRPRNYSDISRAAMTNSNVNYYYQDGVFYVLESNNYRVIEPPIGALVAELPDDYEEIEIAGINYYRVEDTLYKVTVIEGTPYFEVICNL